MFTNATGDLDELTETISEYVNFCVELTIPTKQIKLFSNNKPCITKRVKDIINKKKGLFGKENQTALNKYKSNSKGSFWRK